MSDSRNKKPNSKQKPLRYNNSRLEKARKAIVKEMKTTLPLPEESNELESSSQKEVKRISQYLNAALDVYIKNGKRKVSKSRQATIDKIMKLMDQAKQKKWNKLQLLANIQLLFHDGDYDYGSFGNSELADLIKVAIDMWGTEKREEEKLKHNDGVSSGAASKLYKNGVETLSNERAEKNERNPTQADFASVRYTITLKDFILFGIQQFKDFYIAEFSKTENVINRFKTDIQPSITSFIDQLNRCEFDEQVQDLINKCKIPALRDHLLNTVKFATSLKSDETYLKDLEGFVEREEKEYTNMVKGKPDLTSLDDFLRLKKFLCTIKNEEGVELSTKEEEFCGWSPDLIKGVIDLIDKIKKDNKPELALPKWVTCALYFLCKYADKYPNLQTELKQVTGKDDFMSTYERSLKMKIWSPEKFDVLAKQKDEKEGDKVAGPKKKVILAIHGLNDSSATWEAQACDWAKEGYTVISYDHAGHGQDEHRNNGSLNLQLIQLHLLSQLKALQDNEEIGEIHIAAHSMGGALVAQSLKTINDDFKKVRSITLYAPAAFENPVRSILRAAPYFSKGDREEFVEKERKSGNSGLGGPGVSLSTAGEFMKLTERAYNSLEAVATNKVELRNDLSIAVIAGEDDKLSRKGNFEALEKVRSVFTNLKICILKKVGHSLHEPSSVTQELTGALALRNANLSTDPKAIAARDKLVADFNKIEEICNSLDSKKRPKYKSDYKKILIPYLQKIYERDKSLFHKYIVREFQLGNIDFETLIKLNRLTIDPVAEHIDCNEFSSCLAPKDNKKDKFSATTTASHFKELDAIAKKSDNPGQTNKIYKSEIAMILKLRDERSHYTFFRGGELKTNSCAFFTGTKQLKENAKLNQKDEVIVALKNASYNKPK